MSLWAARLQLARNEWVRDDGRPRSRISRYEQYFHLWERILLRLSEALSHGPHPAEIETLDGLSRALVRAQEEQRLPPDLIRRVLMGTDPHAPPRPQ